MPLAPAATLGESFSSFFDAVDSFFSNLASVRLLPLLLALLLFTCYLTLRARASFNILRAAYPTERIRFQQHLGRLLRWLRVQRRDPGARRRRRPPLPHEELGPELELSRCGARPSWSRLIFDVAMGSLILAFAFTQGVFPKPPDFAKLNAFDLAYLAQHPQFTLFLVTLLAVAGLAGFALLSVRVKAFWERVRQGLTILQDRERYIREVFLVQLGGWCFRFAAFWMLLEAFNVGGSVKNVLLVLGVNAVSAAVPFTPQGAGVQQALLTKVFAGSGAGRAPWRPTRSASRSRSAR